MIEVIICTYNGASYIISQLESITQQSVSVDLISIYDDKSSDETIYLVTQYVDALGESGINIIININEKNLGYANNFSKAISQASGDFIFLCDQDDIWENNKVEVIMSAFTKRPDIDLVFTDGIIINSSGERISNSTILKTYGLKLIDITKFGNDTFSKLIKRNYINGAALAIRKRSAQAALPVPNKMPHDYWLAIWCSIYGGILALPDCLYRYRQHASNTIGIGSNSRYHTFISILRNPALPRLVELERLKTMLPRIATITNNVDHLSLLRMKIEWIDSIYNKNQSKAIRFLISLHSYATGKYKQLSPKHSLLRDLISIIRY